MRRILLLALATVVLATIPQTTGAAPRRKDPPCSVSVDPVTVGQTYVVLATGLPVGTPINLFVTEGGQTVGRPLGSTTNSCSRSTRPQAWPARRRMSSTGRFAPTSVCIRPARSR